MKPKEKLFLSSLVFLIASIFGYNTIDPTALMGGTNPTLCATK